MSVTSNDITNNAAAIAALINGATTEKTIADLDAVTSIVNANLLHCSVSGVDKKITKVNALKIASGTENNIVTIDGDELSKDSGKAFDTDGTLAGNSDNSIPTEKAVKTYADTKLAIASIDDTPADDANTVVSSKWIYDNVVGNLLGSSSAKDDDYDITDTDGIGLVRMTTAAVNRTVTLPTAADNTDREITLIKADSGVAYAILDGEGAETIDYLGIQQTTITVEVQGTGLTVKSNGTSWDVINVIGADIENVGGVLEMVYTKHFSGNLDADTTTLIAHGANEAKILQVTFHCDDDTDGYWRVYSQATNADANSDFFLTFDATNIQILSVGADLQGHGYRAMMRYYI